MQPVGTMLPGYTGGRTQGCYHIKLIKENYEIETTGYKETPRPKIPLHKYFILFSSQIELPIQQGFSIRLWL
jgi:hypothetical protein